MTDWPLNALIVLGVLTVLNVAFVVAAHRFERRYVPPPEDPRILQERAFADDVENHLESQEG